ncbi:MAG: helix-turn-helix domain-containing protein [Planctomycetota bacterium]|jgi:hypothetical protein
MRITEQAEEMIHADEAAKVIGVAPQTLAHWRCTKRVVIPHYKIAGKVWYRRADLADWIESRRVG